MLPVIGLVLARGGSKRLPGKNLKPLLGKPLIAHTIEAARASIGNCYVSSDSKAIRDVAHEYGAVTLARPKELAEDHTVASEVLRYIFRYTFTEQVHQEDAIVVFLNCTSPLRNAKDITDALIKFRESKAESLLSACRYNKFLWEEMDGGGGISRPMNYKPSARPRSQDVRQVYQENGAIYISTIRYIREHDGNWLDEHSAIYAMPENRSFEIDTAEDFELCASIMRGRKQELLKERLSYEDKI